MATTQEGAMKYIFLSLFIVLSAVAMSDEKSSYSDQKAPHTSEIIESYGVNFDLEWSNIIAYCNRRMGIKRQHISLVKNRQTGQLEALATEYDGTDRPYVSVKPDSEVVLKLKQKIVEFEKGTKAKE